MPVGEYGRDRRLGGWRLDELGAVLGLAVAIALFPLRFFVSVFFVEAVPLVIGAASVLYLVTKRYGTDAASQTDWRVAGRLAHALKLTTLVGLGGMVFVATVSHGRTVLFFGVATAVAVLLFCQVLFVERRALRPGLVIVQLLAFAYVLRGAALLTTPGFVGVDGWTHITNYAAAVQTDGLAAISDVKYYGAPLYHLLVVAAAEAFDSTLRTALYLTLGIVLPMSVLLVYFTTKLFLPVRWALFATLAFSLADHVILWGVHIIPTSMGLVLFLATFYGVARISVAGRTTALYGLALLFIVAVVLTHQVSAFITNLFLGTGVLVQLYSRVSPLGTDDSGPGRVNFAALFAVAAPLTVANWALLPPDGEGSFLSGTYGYVQWAVETSAGFLNLASTSVRTVSPDAAVVSVPLSIQVVTAIGFLVLLLITIVGSLVVLRGRNRGVLPLTWVVATGLMLVFTLGLPVFGLYAFVPDRWYAFTYVPMVLLGAYGLYYLEQRVLTRGFVAAILVCSLLLTGPMLTAPKATPENPVWDDYHNRFAYHESELTATETISELHPDEVPIGTDHPYRTLFDRWQGQDTDPLTLANNGTASDDYVVYRRYQTTGSPQVTYNDTLIRVKLPPEDVCRPSMDVRYTNGDVRYCRAAKPPENGTESSEGTDA